MSSPRKTTDAHQTNKHSTQRRRSTEHQRLKNHRGEDSDPTISQDLSARGKERGERSRAQPHGINRIRPLRARAAGSACRAARVREGPQEVGSRRASPPRPSRRGGSAAKGRARHNGDGAGGKRPLEQRRGRKGRRGGGGCGRRKMRMN